MMERRIERRRRVCLEATVADALTGSTETVRLRDITEAGAQIAGAGGREKGQLLCFRLARDKETAQRGRVSWSGMNSFGVEFLVQEQQPAARDASRRFDEIVASAGQGARP